MKRHQKLNKQLYWEYGEHTRMHSVCDLWRTATNDESVRIISLRRCESPLYGCWGCFDGGSRSFVPNRRRRSPSFGKNCEFDEKPRTNPPAALPLCSTDIEITCNGPFSSLSLMENTEFRVEYIQCGFIHKKNLQNASLSHTAVFGDRVMCFDFFRW